MQLISLNVWGGKLFNELLSFIEKNKKVDIFCFQEMYSSSKAGSINRGMRANLYEEIEKILVNHEGYFALHLQSRDLDNKVSYDLYAGLAIFIKKSLAIKDYGNIFIYRRGVSLLHNDYKTIPRNLQYVLFSNKDKDYFVGHFHGIWYPKTKIDTLNRIRQSNKIKQFLSTQNAAKILCGDFNLLPNTKSMKILEEGMKNLIKEFNIPTTRNSLYQREEKHADYALVDPDIHVKKFRALNVTVSDHLPLLLEFT